MLFCIYLIFGHNIKNTRLMTSFSYRTLTRSIFQVPHADRRPNDAVTVTLAQLSNFNSTTIAGAFLPSSYDSCAYLSGFLVCKLIKKHLNLLKSELSQCNDCSNILTTPDLCLHMFLTFKEYKDKADSS